MRRDDEAVAVVVGAIMLVGILALGVASWRLGWVPVLAEEREVDHSAGVVRELGDLATTVARQVRGQGAATAAQALTLGVPGREFPSMPAVGHSIAFESGERPLELHAASLLVVEDNGGRVLGPQETFIPIGASTTVTAIGPVKNLRLRVTEVSDLNNGHNVTLVARDADGRRVASLVIRVEQDPPDFYIVKETKDAAGVIVTRTTETYFQQTDLAPYWVDALDQQQRFGLFLAGAKLPLSLTMTTNGLPTSYAMTYDTVTDDGSLPGSNAGRPVTPFARTYTSDSVRYRAPYPDFVDQSYVLEHGSLLRFQGDDAVFLVQPSVAVRMQGGTVAISVTAPSVRAATSGASGVATVSVRTSVANVTHLAGWSSNLSLVIPSAAPGAWVDNLRDAFEGAGVPSTAYTLAAGDGRVRLDIRGMKTTAEPDVFLTLDRAVVHMEVGR